MVGPSYPLVICEFSQERPWAKLTLVSKYGIDDHRLWSLCGSLLTLRECCSTFMSSSSFANDFRIAISFFYWCWGGQNRCIIFDHRPFTLLVISPAVFTYRLIQWSYRLGTWTIESMRHWHGELVIITTSSWAVKWYLSRCQHLPWCVNAMTMIVKTLFNNSFTTFLFYFFFVIFFFENRKRNVDVTCPWLSKWLCHGISIDVCVLYCTCWVPFGYILAHDWVLAWHTETQVRETHLKLHFSHLL